MVDYFVAGNKILQTFLKIKNSEEWEYVTTIDSTQLHKNLFPKVCAYPAFRIKTLINKPHTEIFKMIWNINEKDAKIIDPKLISRDVIEEGSNWKIILQYNGGTWPIMTRSFLCFQVEFNIDNKLYIVSKSIDNKNIPKSEPSIRANIHMGVYELIPIDDKSTEINYIIHIDPCGYIPVWLVEMYSTNFLNMFNSWKQ